MNIFKRSQPKPIVPANDILKIVDEKNYELVIFRYDFSKEYSITISKEIDHTKISSKAKALTFDEALSDAWIKFQEINK